MMKNPKTRLILYGVLLGMCITFLLYITTRPSFVVSSSNEYFFKFVGLVALSCSFAIGLGFSIKGLQQSRNN